VLPLAGTQATPLFHNHLPIDLNIKRLQIRNKRNKDIMTTSAQLPVCSTTRKSNEVSGFLVEAVIRSVA
jgi:hypothetical protein